MIYYVKLNGKYIEHAVTYPVDGYIKISTLDTPLPSEITDNYKWDGEQYIYNAVYSNSGLENFIDGFVSNSKLSVDELYEIGRNVYNNFALLKDIRIKKLSADCRSSILAGFKSSCLDNATEKHYDCELTDQARISNLVNLAISSPTSTFKYKASGELEYSDYSALAIIKLGLDMNTHIEYFTNKFYTLRKQTLDCSKFDDL